jgi:ribosomal protein S18
MSSTTNQNIYHKPCVYNCNTLIYWNFATHEYWEVFTKKKHICPNSENKTTTTNTSAATPTKRPSYCKKPWSSQQPKPKMSNYLNYCKVQLMQYKKKYETLSDIVTEYGGKVHVAKETEIQRLASSTWYIMKFH